MIGWILALVFFGLWLWTWHKNAKAWDLYVRLCDTADRFAREITTYKQVIENKDAKIRVLEHAYINGLGHRVAAGAGNDRPASAQPETIAIPPHGSTLRRGDA